MARFIGKTLSFGYSIQDELDKMQTFFTFINYIDAHSPESPNASYSYQSRKYRVIFDDPFGGPFYGEFTFSGNFSSPAPQFTDTEGKVTSFSAYYKEYCGLDNCRGISGSFKANNIGKHNIELHQLFNRPSKGAAAWITRGSDKITGPNHNDTLLGGNGNDVIKGGNGRDKLFGGRGRNTLYGGKGGDTFVLENRGVQIVKDFNHKHDKIDLPGPQLPGLDEFSFVEVNSKKIFIGFQGQSTTKNYLMELNSKQAFDITDISFI